jgi:hypothetical protein
MHRTCSDRRDDSSSNNSTNAACQVTWHHHQAGNWLPWCFHQTVQCVSTARTTLGCAEPTVSADPIQQQASSLPQPKKYCRQNTSTCRTQFNNNSSMTAAHPRLLLHANQQLCAAFCGFTLLQQMRYWAAVKVTKKHTG